MYSALGMFQRSSESWRSWSSLTGLEKEACREQGKQEEQKAREERMARDEEAYLYKMSNPNGLTPRHLSGGW